MRKSLMVLVAIVVFAAVVSSEAATTFKYEADTNPSSTMVVRGTRGPMGPQGPQGPAGQVPAWYLWLAIGALGLSLIALAVALALLQSVAYPAPAPVIVNNYPPAVGNCPAARNVPNQL